MPFAEVISPPTFRGRPSRYLGGRDIKIDLHKDCIQMHSDSMPTGWLRYFTCVLLLAFAAGLIGFDCSGHGLTTFLLLDINDCEFAEVEIN